MFINVQFYWIWVLLSITHCHFFGVVVEKAEVPTDAYQEEDRQKNLAFLLEKVEGCAVCLILPILRWRHHIYHSHTHTKKAYTLIVIRLNLFCCSRMFFGGTTVTSKWMIINHRFVILFQNVMEVPGRYLVHSGDLVELDPDNFSQMQKIHGFLLNDSLMFASWLPHRLVLFVCFFFSSYCTFFFLCMYISMLICFWYM